MVRALSAAAGLVSLAVSLQDEALASWEWQYEDPVEERMGEVHFVDQQNGWAIGGAHTILRTTDGGQSWQNVDSYGYGGWAIHFADTQEGWAAGGECGGAAHYRECGYILHTTDGGGTWEEQIAKYSIEYTRFYGLHFVDNWNGWAVIGGHWGRAYHTADGGDTWVEQVLPNHHVQRYLLGVHFEDPSLGWVVGGHEYPDYDSGEVYRTTDGGNSWQLQKQHDMCLYDVWFASPTEGWAVGGGSGDWGGVILHTSDGGGSWDEQYRTDGWGPHLGSVCFVDDQTGWVVGAEYSCWGVAVLSTSDGGQTWGMDPAAGSWPLDKPLNGVHFVDASTGWAVGRDQRIVKYTGQSAYVTVNSPPTGAFWWVGDWEDIEWSSSGTSGWLDVAVSRDGGVNWTIILEDTQDDGAEAWSVTGPPSGNCYVRIADVDGDPWGTSGQFTIGQPTVAVTSPVAGETWWVGDEEHIQWTSSGTSGTVRIEISRDSGSTWSTIDSGTPDDGDHPWTVDGPASSVCCIKVTDADGSPSGTSGTFAISRPDIVVTAPASGETWWVGDEEHIQWTSSGTSGLVVIEISRDGGGNWGTIFSSTIDNGDTTWTVTGPPSADCVVRVSDSDGSPSGTSGTFTITSVEAGETASAGALSLSVCGPHPCFDTAMLACSVPRAMDVRLVVYDPSGRLAAELYRGALAADTRFFRWSGEQTGGTAATQGLYVVRLETSEGVLTRRLVLVR